MDSDQREHALKKAYADVILNASIEAAARVMAAERKAQRLEHELKATKDEALQMMVRLKRMIDDKISEANITSRKQQEKIDELEAQLQEAEDIVSELREELRYEQAKSDRGTRSDMQHLDKHDIANTPEEAFEDNRQSQSIPCPPLEFQKDSLVASDKENPYPNQRTEHPKCSSEPVQMRNLYGAMPELPSIIRRSKQQKFYRNGCTQRIHACERNILDNELSLSRQPDDASSKGKVEGAKKDISTCKVTSDEIHKMFNIESKEAVDKNGSISCWYEVRPINLIPRKVKTAAKYRKNKGVLGKKIPDKLFMRRHETPGVHHSDPSPKSVENNPQPNEDPTLTTPMLYSAITGMETQPECAKTTETNNNDKEGDTGKLIYKAEPPVNIVVPIVQEGASTESSDIQVSKSNLKKVNEPVLQSELKTTDATSKGPSLQYFKYTFQRKRKRETASISGGNVSAYNRTPERRKETQNTFEEPEKSRLVAELSLENRQVAQVARQLMSLSKGKY